jgi:transcription termination factor Rho
MHLLELKRKTLADLVSLARGMGVEEPAGLKRQDLLSAILHQHARKDGTIQGEGVLECVGDGFGFLRATDASYLPGPDDVYVSQTQVRRFGLRTGDTISGTIRPPKDGERYFALVKVDVVNGEAPHALGGANGTGTFGRERPSFDDLTPLYPNRKFTLEQAGLTPARNLPLRALDVVVPIGMGQRCLIVSPPRAGKTVLMQSIASSIRANHPKVDLLVLLIDERPEEVTDMRRTVDGEVVSSTFDEPAARHVQVAEMVLEKAKRLVEQKHDVVILLDSVTRLARAYNAVVPPSGKVLTGGLDSQALHKPKRFFGAARNVEEGGSLTIIATALVETGSRMDEVIFEEFKGTGNSEVHLDRRLMERRIFPCLDIAKSGTRKEELLIPERELSRVWLLRQLLHPLGVADSMEFLLEKLKKTEDNAAFLASMNDG